jgi:hypothetical protein
MKFRLLCLRHSDSTEFELSVYVRVCYKSGLCFQRVSRVISVRKYRAKRKYGGVAVYIHALLTSAFYGDEWVDSRPVRSIPWEEGPVPI